LAKPPPSYSHGFGIVFNFQIQSGHAANRNDWLGRPRP
jgi:hypothetical protein